MATTTITTTAATTATAATTPPDFDAAGAKVLSPSALAHVVLRTNQLEAMVAFYVQFLGGRISHRNDSLAFVTYDEEHHRVALIHIPPLAAKNSGTCGLDHLSFAFATLDDLLLAYRQRKARGIDPFWSVNHGPTTSIYYKDPDGNLIETQVDNFATPEAATRFMTGPAFAENPIGTDIDPEALIAARRQGTPASELLQRKEMGPRGLPDFL